jgi:D-psicose/D-tagatose/L-ribulose 3-epimerase
MKLAVSNIAWEPLEEDQAAELLRSGGIDAVEIAPTKYWPAPCSPSAKSIDEVRRRWADKGIRIVALQSLLFGCPQLSIFAGAGLRRQTSDYLRNILDIAKGLGAKALVFGSPKNRDKGQRPFAAALGEAADFFRPLAQHAAELSCAVAFEPNPTQYGCNFCTTVDESLALLESVDHPGLRLNLDIGIMHLNGEPMAETIARALPWTAHVHLSEPSLATIGTAGAPHALAAHALRSAGWTGYVSIEMRTQPVGQSNLDAVGHAIAAASEHYLRRADHAA